MKYLFIIAGLFWAGYAFCYQNVEQFDQDHSKLKVVVFLSSHCPCSKSHVDHLNTLNKAYKNVHFYGVATDIFNQNTKDALDEFYHSKGFNFPIIKDDKQNLVDRFKALKTPHVTILKKDKKNHYKMIYSGGVSDHRIFEQSHKHYLEENLEALSKGLSLKYIHGKSLGCYIRRL